MINSWGIADHLTASFYPKRLAASMAQTVNIITTERLNFDAIAFTGVSGAAFGFPLCYELEKYPIYLRKRRSKHSAFLIETAAAKDVRFLIVDDVIDTGKTIKRLLKYLGRENCVGMIVYQYGPVFKPIETL